MLSGLFEVYMRLNWFISMSTFNFFHPIMYTAIILPVFLIGLNFLISRNPIQSMKDKAYTSAKLSISNLTLIWVVIGVLGAVFVNKGPFDAYETYASYSLLAFMAFYVIYGSSLIYFNKGHRVHTTSMFLLNTYFVLSISFVAGMSISGTWL